MTNEVSAELLKLAETAPMSAGTRTRIRDAALKVQTLEREHTELAKGWGKSLGEIYGQASAEPTGAQRHVDEIVPAAALPPELQGLADSFAKAFGNSPRRIEPDIREKVFGNAAGTMARKLDAAIADALNRFLPDGWTMDDVKRRCVRVKGPNSDVETLCMDGVPLLEIHPIEMEKVPNETGFSVRFTQKYRDLKPLNRGAPRE
jgi:hypothetical protein